MKRLVPIVAALLPPCRLRRGAAPVPPPFPPTVNLPAVLGGPAAGYFDAGASGDRTRSSRVVAASRPDRDARDDEFGGHDRDAPYCAVSPVRDGERLVFARAAGT